MAGKRSAFNPFYLLLVVLGIAFTLTACAYVVMMLKALQPNAEPAAPQSRLLAFVDRHGATLMTGELLLLAAATVGAISTDRYWMRRKAKSPLPPDQPPTP